MSDSTPSTRERIVAAARAQVFRDGPTALTLDGVAAEVGVTKQAVLYHVRSRGGLLAEVYLELLAEESDALVAPLESAPGGRPAARTFLDAALSWYLADPTRFRMLYAAAQLGQVDVAIDEQTRRERVYPVTGRLYSAVAERLGATGDVAEPRRLAIALHMFALGVACYQGMLEACDERFAHDWSDIADALLHALDPPVNGGDPRP